jgi:hypothetical protein
MRRWEAPPIGSAGVSARRSSTGWPGLGDRRGRAGIHPAPGERWFAEEAAMAAEMERDLIRERTLDGLRVAQVQGRRGGRPAAVDDDDLAIARARRERGESVTAIARRFEIAATEEHRIERSAPFNRGELGTGWQRLFGSIVMAP